MIIQTDEKKSIVRENNVENKKETSGLQWDGWSINFE